MKKTKLAVLFAAAMAMVGFTSCLNGEVDSTRRGALILKYKTDNLGSGEYFEDAAGRKYIPNKTMDLDPTSELANVPLEYDPSLFNAEKQSYDITLLGTPVFLPKCNPVPTEVPTEGTTASFVVYNEGYNRGGLWGADNEYLVLPVGYYLNKDVTQEGLKEELSKHHISVYSPSGKNLSENGDSLKLYIRYTIDGVNWDGEEESAKEYEETYTTPYTEWIYVPMKNLLVNQDLNKLKFLRVSYETVKDYMLRATIDPSKKKDEVVSYTLYQKEQ